MNLFEKLGVDTALVNGLKMENIDTPTEIQEKVIPIALSNRDVVGQSETGTGKTLAYLLPVFQKIDIELKEMQAIILAPTHELAVQIHNQAMLLAKNSEKQVKTALLIGNVSMTRQIEKLREKPHIIIGSTGRILELIKQKKIKAHTIKTIVVDEADRLLDENNISDVKAIIKSTLKERQLMMFSATMPQQIIGVTKEMMKEPEIIKIERGNVVSSDISHMYILVDKRDKVEMIRKIVSSTNPERAIIFVAKSDEIEITAEKLKFHGLKAASIHGTALKEDRKKVMDDFRAGKIQLLVASDIAARGLDIKGVTHIISIDIPEDPKKYLHRAGRTGRAGEKGTSILIVEEKEIPLVQKYEKMYKISIPQKEIYKGKIFDMERV